MVKVLVPGRNRIYTTVCKWCRSVLEYQQDDIVEENVEEARKREQTFPTFISRDSIKCPNCDISLTYHKTSNSNRCHYCNYSVKNVRKCSECGSDNIKDYGLDTEFRQ